MSESVSVCVCVCGGSANPARYLMHNLVKGIEVCYCFLDMMTSVLLIHFLCTHTMFLSLKFPNSFARSRPVCNLTPSHEQDGIPRTYRSRE